MNNLLRIIVLVLMLSVCLSIAGCASRSPLNEAVSSGEETAESENTDTSSQDKANSDTLNNNTVDESRRPVKKIARIGYRPYDSNTPPEQSIASYEAACENGYTILLCDVRTTSDGHFVALHDATINSYACDATGQRIKDSEPVKISDITLAKADEYDFGVYKGERYKGTKIMRVAEFIEFCAKKGVCPHLELKETFTNQKLDELIGLIRKYNVQDNLMINGQNADNLRYLAAALPNAVMGTWVNEINDLYIEQIATYGANNPKFIYVSNGGEHTITPENYSKCQKKGIVIAYTEIRSEAELEAFRSSGLMNYCKYVATRYDLYS